MDPIEKAIRNALEKGDVTDEAFRERVYRSAFSVFERALASRTSLTPEEIEARRDRLRTRIMEIETEFVPALPADEEDDEADFGSLSDIHATPSIRPEERLRPADHDDFDIGEPAPQKPKRRGALIFLLLAIGAALVVLLVAVWIVFGGSSGPAGSDALPPASQDNGQVPGMAQEDAAPERDWLRIFTPEDSTNVALAGGATADILAEEGVAFLRLSGGSQSVATFDIGRGILEQMAGHDVLISILARSGEADAAQMAVECAFAELGDCGRKRFEIGTVPTEFLFEVEIPAGTPQRAGGIMLSPALGGDGAVIDIQEIRVAITSP